MDERNIGNYILISFDLIWDILYVYQSIFCTCSFPAYKHDVLASDRQSPQTCVEKLSWMDPHYQPVLQNQFIIFGFSFQHCLFLYMLVIFIIYCSQPKLYNHCKPPLQKNTANIMCYKSDMFFPSLLWTCMLSIEYHFNNKGF